jgi:hypothetical protein
LQGSWQSTKLRTKKPHQLSISGPQITVLECVDGALYHPETTPKETNYFQLKK